MNKLLILIIIICLSGCTSFNISSKTSPIADISIGLLDIYVNDEKTYKRLLDLGYENIEIIELPLSDKNISPYDILYLPFGWASYGDEQFLQIEAASTLIQEFVRDGGGLFIEQPNPYMNGLDHTVTPKILPYQVTFNNESAKINNATLDNNHPITKGLTVKDIPYSSDTLSFIAPEFNIIIKATNQHASPLLVADYGKGKILICTHNSSKRSMHPTADEIFIRMVNWLGRVQ